MSNGARGERSRCRMVGYSLWLAFPEEPSSIDDTEIERRLERAVCAGTVARGQFDTGRGRFAWWNGWPGQAMRELRAEIERLTLEGRMEKGLEPPRPPPLLPRQGRRPLIELVWSTAAPGRKALARLNGAWQAIDYDAPELTENGAIDVWRKPLIRLAEAAAVLHALGWPCRWRAVADSSEIEPAPGEPWEAAERRELDAQPWQHSDPGILASVRPWQAPIFAGVSRAIDRLLPPAAPAPKKARRTFGRRRGVKRLRPPPAGPRRKTDALSA